jgi:murein DD-endopeptidase MepM/ murein hydrolase activator NlpD
MVALRRLRLLGAAIAVVAVIAACQRTAPPAPVVAGAANRAPITALPPDPPPLLASPPTQVTVRSGDTLYNIARRHDVPVRTVIDANGLAPPYTLDRGQRLNLPQARLHIVQVGETIYAVSRLYGVDTSSLARTNGLAPPYSLRAGQSLTLPAPVEGAGAGAPPVIQATVPSGLTRPAAPAADPVVVTAGAAVAPRVESPPPIASGTAEPPPAQTPAPADAASPAPERTAALPPPTASRGSEHGFLWPVRGHIIAAFGGGGGGTHNDGINIAAPAGTAVVAADAGIVAYAGNELRGYGNLVLLKHANGWMTAYAHNAALLVKRGDHVSRGQTIARVGSTGTVGEPQLHFEIRHGTRPVDPGDYLPEMAVSAARG